MRKKLLLPIIIFLFACQSNDSYGPVAEPVVNGIHTVVVEEVIQTSQYTYIQATEGNDKIWLATNKMNATVGETYYYKEGLTMTNFKSKELDRTFSNILFLDNISSIPIFTDNNEVDSTPNTEAVSTGSKILIDKLDIHITHAKDEVSIASLYENKASYSGKTIKIKGQVVKFNDGIMDKNWIHLQDGTSFSNNFDLTITTLENVAIGDEITVSGIINLDKDFGYGYFYDVIMEDATIVN